MLFRIAILTQIVVLTKVKAINVSLPGDIEMPSSNGNGMVPNGCRTTRNPPPGVMPDK